MMKFVVVLVVVLASLDLAVSDVDEQMIAFSQECIAATGVDKNLAMKLKAHDFSSDDPKLKVNVSYF